MSRRGSSSRLVPSRRRLTLPSPRRARTPSFASPRGRTDLIGQGAYGTVYRGTQRATNRTVAIKRIPYADSTPEGGVPCNVIREISLLRELTHNNVVQLLDVIQATPGGLYLVFEYVAHDLKTFMDQRQRSDDIRERIGLPGGMVRSFMRQILNGVGYCHTHRVLHRDLKPHNVSRNILSMGVMGKYRWGWVDLFRSVPFCGPSGNILMAVEFWGLKMDCTHMSNETTPCGGKEMYLSTRISTLGNGSCLSLFIRGWVVLFLFCFDEIVSEHIMCHEKWEMGEDMEGDSI